MANRALCHLRLQENDGTAKVILVPAAEHKGVYRFRRASGFEPKSNGILASHCSVRLDLHREAKFANQR